VLSLKCKILERGGRGIAFDPPPAICSVNTRLKFSMVRVVLIAIVQYLKLTKKGSKFK